MKQSQPITETRHSEFFQQAVNEMRQLTGAALESVIADSVATNRQLAEFLIESRRVVEEEAILTVDALTLAFDDKAGKLKTLKSATESVSSEVAFMKSSLSTVETKTREIEQLTASIDLLTESLARFKAMVDEGTFDLAARVSAAMCGHPAKR